MLQKIAPQVNLVALDMPGAMLSRDEVAGKHVDIGKDMPIRATPVKAWRPGRVQRFGFPEFVMSG